MLSVPATAGSGESDLPMVRIGSEVTVVVIAPPATATVSLLSMAYDPLVMSVPLGSGLATCTTICTEPDDPAFKAPMFQVTTPPASAPPPVADTKLVFVGTVSVMTTPLAFSFPAFEYDRV